METHTDFRVSYLIQTFVNKINTKLWNDCQVHLTNDFYYKVDQYRAILATLSSLFLTNDFNYKVGQNRAILATPDSMVAILKFINKIFEKQL